MVTLVVGIAYLLQVVSSSPFVIMSALFLAGVMACGYFIIQLPFISYYAGEKRNSAYTINSIVFYSAASIGGMMGGFLPDILGRATANESIAFRIILVVFSFLIILGTIPLFFLEKDQPDKDRKISLSP